MIRRAGFFLVMVALVTAGCASASETVAERIIESGDGVTDVNIEGDQVTVEFDDEEGGGSVVIGNSDVPDGLLIDLPNGGEVVTSFELNSDYGVTLNFPLAEFDDLVDFYTDWVADQGAENVANTSTTNPRSEGWFGETADGQFVISLFEGADSSGTPVVTVSLNWATATP